MAGIVFVMTLAVGCADRPVVSTEATSSVPPMTTSSVPPVTEYSIVSDSMSPALRIGDRVIWDPIDAADIGRGDIVVFLRPPYDPPSDPTDPPLLISRVIGIPGDIVSARSGGLVVNGERVPNTYVPEGGFESLFPKPVSVLERYVMVLADHHATSSESDRPPESETGLVSTDLIRGRVVQRVAPPDRVGPL